MPIRLFRKVYERIKILSGEPNYPRLPVHVAYFGLLVNIHRFEIYLEDLQGLHITDKQCCQPRYVPRHHHGIPLGPAEL